eukprot:jgi/Botrbrau1/20240/Bobra.31_1s0033.1
MDSAVPIASKVPTRPSTESFHRGLHKMGFWGLLRVLPLFAACLEAVVGVTATEKLFQGYHPAKVAVSVQGKVDELQLWMMLYGAMSSRNNVGLYLLSYDKPYKCPAHMHCFYFPNSTWTTGRNALAQKIYQTEQGTGHSYKYWCFHDADTWDLSCVACSGIPDRLNRSACCFDQYVTFLLGPQNFAQVSPGHTANGVVAAPTSPFELVRLDCIDAMKNALHREAVPVLLPYIASLDQVSWWISQALEFHTSVGCLSGYTAVLGGYGEPQIQEHSPYPQGRNDTLERETVDRVFRSRGLVPWPIGGQFLEQGNCGGLKGVPELMTDAIFASADWMTSKAFLTCRSGLMSRFLKFMGPLPTSAEGAHRAVAPAPSLSGT